MGSLLFCFRVGDEVIMLFRDDTFFSNSVINAYLLRFVFYKYRCHLGILNLPFFFWRMIPHKTKRGEAALARLKVYEGVPPPYDKMKRMVIPDALKWVLWIWYHVFSLFDCLSLDIDILPCWVLQTNQGVEASGWTQVLFAGQAFIWGGMEPLWDHQGMECLTIYFLNLFDCLAGSVSCV